MLGAEAAGAIGVKVGDNLDIGGSNFKVAAILKPTPNLALSFINYVPLKKCSIKVQICCQKSPDDNLRKNNLHPN